MQAEKGRVANVTEAGLHYACLNASRTAGHILSKSVEYHSREAHHEQDLANASEFKDEIKASIKAWAYQVHPHCCATCWLPRPHLQGSRLLLVGAHPRQTACQTSDCWDELTKRATMRSPPARAVAASMHQATHRVSLTACYPRQGLCITATFEAHICCAVPARVL
jgi:hypothetical protein